MIRAAFVSPSHASSLVLIQQHLGWGGGGGGERNAKLAATAVSPISLLNHPPRERKIWSLILL